MLFSHSAAVGNHASYSYKSFHSNIAEDVIYKIIAMYQSSTCVLKAYNIGFVLVRELEKDLFSFLPVCGKIYQDLSVFKSIFGETAGINVLVGVDVPPWSKDS